MPAYYLSPSGDDANDGLSELRPWKSLEKLSAFPAQPGDVFRLQGTFPGTLDWFWKDIGDGSTPITVGNYGTGSATIASPISRPGFFYAGLGGIALENLRFTGQLGDPKIGGVVIEPANGNCRNVRLTGVEAYGYGLGGAVIQSVQGLRIERGYFHHNVNGLFLSETRDAVIVDTLGDANDYLGPLRTDLQAANGIGVFWSKDVSIYRCQANRNGLRTTGSGGHAGIFVSDSDRCKVHRSEAHGNGDATGQDGQGICLYGSRDCEIADWCLATGNLNAGLCLFHDEHTPFVERCEIRDSVATGSLCDLSIVGTVLDSAVHGNRIYSTRHKAMDIAGHEGGTYYRRNVKVYGNDFHAAAGNYLLVAVPGLAGVEGLTANGWHAEVAEPFLVRNRGYTKIDMALAAEPVGV